MRRTASPATLVRVPVPWTWPTTPGRAPRRPRWRVRRCRHVGAGGGRGRAGAVPRGAPHGASRRRDVGEVEGGGDGAGGRRRAGALARRDQRGGRSVGRRELARPAAEGDDALTSSRQALAAMASATPAPSDATIPLVARTLRASAPGARSLSPQGPAFGVRSSSTRTPGGSWSVVTSRHSGCLPGPGTQVRYRSGPDERCRPRADRPGRRARCARRTGAPPPPARRRRGPRRSAPAGAPDRRRAARAHERHQRGATRSSAHDLREVGPPPPQPPGEHRPHERERDEVEERRHQQAWDEPGVAAREGQRPEQERVGDREHEQRGPQPGAPPAPPQTRPPDRLLPTIGHVGPAYASGTLVTQRGGAWPRRPPGRTPRHRST